MDDLFPESLKPEAIGFGAIRDVAPVFFAIYPSADDLPRVLAWRQRICAQRDVPSIAPRPDELLHVSVAEAGVPRRLREPLEVALRLAAECFSYPPFELTLDALAGGFGRDGRALVALADASGTNSVNGLRVALADAQKPFGLSANRGASAPHLTLGYGDGLPDERRAIEPVSFRVEAVDLVASNVGKSEHLHLARWFLGQRRP
jgi:2'-5' RNA ligase